MTEYNFWCDVYKNDLNQLYTIYLENSFKSKIQFNKVIPFNTFCRIIYEQSSKTIGKYDY